jgi:tetratricopeptide (TPR) repeat protein
VPTLHIPETLQDLLAARLDQLGPVKQVAQLASVLGREFSYDLLLEISPLREDQLQRVLADAVSEELVHEQEAAPDARYFFKHALIRDAAYQSMLHRTRQGHHRLVAETLTDQVPGIAEEQPEVVAHHWSQSDLPERAIPWWQRAGQRSFAVHALEEAIAHLRRGLAQLASQPAGEERDREELAFQWLLARALFAVRGFSTEETRSVYTRAAELCRFELDPRRRAAVMYGVVIAYINSAPLDRAASEAATVLESGRRSGDLATLATGELLTGICRLYEGRIAAACEHTSRAVEVCEQESVSFIEWGFPEDVAPVVRAWQGWALWHAGMAERSERACEGAVVQARSGRDPYSLGVALNWQAFVAIMRRDPPAARRMGKEVRRMADEQGFPFLEDWGQLCLHWADAVESGDVEPVDQFEAVLLKQSKNGSHGAAPWSLEELAALRLIAGQPEAGLRTVELGQAFADRTGEHFRDAGLHRVAGECLVALEPGSEGEAEAHFLEALTISRRQGVKPLELRAATSLARLWRGQGKTAEARELLGPVHAWFTEGFDTQDLKDAQVLLQELS